MKRICCFGLVWLVINLMGAMPAMAKTLRLGFLTKPQTLNPVISLMITGHYINDLLFNSLYAIHKTGPDRYTLEPELASVEPLHQEDRAYIITLRDDVRWHNNAPFRARDVLATYHAIMGNPKTSNVFSRVAKIERIELIDTLKLKVVFKGYTGPTEAMDCLNFKIIPFFQINPNAAHIPDWNIAEVLGNTEYAFEPNDQLSLYPCGTGPFRMRMDSEYQPEGSQSLILERNPDYFKGMPEISEVQIKFYSQFSAMIGDINSGNLHLIINPPSELVPNLIAARKYYRIARGKYSELIFIGYNLSRDLGRMQTRQMLSALLMPQVMDWNGALHANAQEAVDGIVRRVNGPITLDHYYSYGIDNVTRSLPAAGTAARPSASQAPYRIVYKSFDPEQRALASYLKDQLDDAGLAAKLVSLGVNRYYRMVTQKTGYDLVLFRIRPSSSLEIYFPDCWRSSAPFNITRYADTQTDQLIAEMDDVQRGSDMAETICRRVYDRIVDALPATWLWSYMDVVAVNQRLDMGSDQVNFMRPFADVEKWRRQ